MHGIYETVNIFIMDGDPVTSSSQKCLLESYQHSVEIIKHDGRPEISHINNRDIVLLDVETEQGVNFPVLDQFLKVSERPKLLITAFENQIFRRGDELKGGAAHILFKPFSPRDLISAVTYLCDISLA